jgi:hypothetical protein
MKGEQSEMKSAPIALGLVVAALALVVLAALYGTGTLNLFTSSAPHQPHVKHAILLVVLAGLCLVGANFARRRPA